MSFDLNPIVQMIYDWLTISFDIYICISTMFLIGRVPTKFYYNSSNYILFGFKADLF